MFALRESHRSSEEGGRPVCLPAGWTQNGHTASRCCVAITCKLLKELVAGGRLELPTLGL